MSVKSPTVPGRRQRLSNSELRPVSVLTCLAFGWLLLWSMGGCAPSAGLGSALATRPVATQASVGTDATPSDWPAVAQALGRSGQLNGNVYTLIFPRDDLYVNIEGMQVPTAAGIASIFHFYRCSCGKTAVVGRFIVADYEANDVAYALQKQDILISSMAPFLIYEKPRLMSICFQAEGPAPQLARALKSALDWTGKNRMR